MTLSHTLDDMEQWIDKLNNTCAITSVHLQRSDSEVPRVRGFTRSAFNPLIYQSVKNVYLQANLQNVSIRPESIGILLSSMFVDAVTEQETWGDMLNGKRLSPIMFPQSVPNAIIGFLGNELNIRGPMTCMSISGNNSVYQPLLQAYDWIEEQLADMVILTFCDVSSFRSEQWTRMQYQGRKKFRGGVYTILLQSKQTIEANNQQPIMTIKQWLSSIGKDEETPYFDGAVPL